VCVPPRFAAPDGRATTTVRVAASIGIGAGPPTESAILVHASDRTDQRVVSDLLTVDGNEIPLGDGGSPVRLVTHGWPTSVIYTAEVELLVSPCGPLAFADRVGWLYPSRYCPVDRLIGYARTEFGTGGDDAIASVAEFVNKRLEYVGNTSSTSTTAIDTLVEGRGVCRDFAHLTICLLRALSVPARYVAAYVPGVVRPDFHALVEAHDGERWCLLDPTGLSDPTHAVRIAHGRDGADVAFLTTMSGDLSIFETTVSAVCA
jgi:transglutaminase-like putative cysteine protease